MSAANTGNLSNYQKPSTGISLDPNGASVTDYGGAVTNELFVAAVDGFHLLVSGFCGLCWISIISFRSTQVNFG